MFTEKNLEESDYTFLEEAKKDLFLHDEWKVSQIKDYRKQLGWYKDNENYITKKEEINKFFLTRLTQEDLDNSIEKLEKIKKIEELLIQCIGGFTSFTCFKEHSIKFHFNCGYHPDPEQTSLYFIGIQFVSYENIREWFIKD